MNGMNIPETLKFLNEMADSLHTQDDAMEEMYEGMIRGIREKHEQDQLTKEANQSQIDSLPVAKESLAEQQWGNRLTILSIGLSILSLIVAGIALFRTF
jgi:hypothetical protein